MSAGDPPPPAPPPVPDPADTYSTPAAAPRAIGQVSPLASMPEVGLWLAVVEDAVNAAKALALGRTPTAVANGNSQPSQADLVRMAQELDRWTTTAAVGGLQWISDVVEATTGTVINRAAVAGLIARNLDRWAELELSKHSSSARDVLRGS